MMLRILVFAFLLCALATNARACGGKLLESPYLLQSPVCAPTDAKRIVVLDPTYSLGMSLELDLPVVGAPLFGMSDAALRSKAEARGVADLGAFTEPSLEKIIALKPDLIIGSSMFGEKVYDIASRIAPTALISAEDWKTYYRLIAEITGRESAADAAFKAYDTRVAQMRSRIPDVRVSIVRITPWDFQVYLDSPNAYGPFDVLRDLAVKRPDYETDHSEGLTLKRPDWEALHNLNGDILLYIVGGANNSDTSGRHEEVIESPLWKMLPAVEAGHVHRVDAGTWMEFSGLASAGRVLDDVERYVVNGQ